jgi:hypothetical protein
MMIQRILRRELVMAALVAMPSTGGITEDTIAPPYELVALERKLYRETPEPEVQLEQRARLLAGDLLRTGSRSSADILCPKGGARFHLGSKTRARLASETPGVLLELEKGRIRALFDVFAGAEAPDRLVTTPSAVLAVRGTEYGVDVDAKGNTRVVVFSGEVVVREVGGLGKQVRVGAGQYCDVRRGKPPRTPAPHRMGPEDWDRGARVGLQSHRDDTNSGMGRSGDMGGSGSSGMGSGSGRGGSGGGRG